MQQALHIFRKDVRYLRYEIGLTLLVAAAFCLIGVQRGLSTLNVSPQHDNGAGPLLILLPVSWWLLIVRVIHAESLTGERQFWLTRPYQWRSLLGAKTLFILAFVNLPLLVADTATVAAHGFSAPREAAGLLWMQILLTAAFTLPVAALSSIVTGLAPLITAMLLLVSGLLTAVMLSPWLHGNSFGLELEWVKTYYVLAIIAAAGITIVLWQYAKRKTALTRMIAIIAVTFALLGGAVFPWQWAFSLQTLLSRQTIDPSAMHIRLNPDRKWLGHVYPAMQNQMAIDLPLLISGIPTGMQLKPNGISVTLYAPDGETWQVPQAPPLSVTSEAGIISLRAVAGNSFYAKVKDHPIQFRGTLFFTLYGDAHRTSVPPRGGLVRVGGVGICSSGEHFILCSSAFRARPDLVSIQVWQDSSHGSTTRTENPRLPISYSPFPADLAISPVGQFFLTEVNTVSAAAIDTLEPLAHLRKDFELDNVRLTDYEWQTSITPVESRPMPRRR